MISLNLAAIPDILQTISLPLFFNSLVIFLFSFGERKEDKQKKIASCVSVIGLIAAAIIFVFGSEIFK